MRVSAKRWCGALLILLLSWGGGWPPGFAATDANQSRRELQQIRERIGDAAKELEAKKRAGLTLQQELEKVEAELSRARARLKRLRSQLEQSQAQIRELEEREGETRRNLDSLQVRLEKRLVALYKNRTAGNLGLLFSTDSLPQLTRQWEYLVRILNHDRKLIGEYRSRMTELEGILADLHSARERLREDQQELTAEQSSLSAAQTRKADLLARVKQEQKSLEERIAALKERAERLQSLVKKLESAKGQDYTDATGPFAAQKGALPWPVPGELVLRFGPQRHPELGTRFDSHGIEIAVEGEQAVAALWDGKVVYADRLKGYENLIIVGHGRKFYSIYGHSSRLVKGVGDRVRRGELLGYVGAGGADRLYLEIRQGGTPLDPLQWLAPR